MTLLHRLVSIVRWMTNRNRAEANLDDELQTFVDMAAAEQIRNGATPTEARRLATLQLGGVEQAKERVRTARHGAWLDGVWRDLHYGLRQVGRNRAFSVIAIATLALGVGVNTAMFSAVDAVLIRPLPYLEADRLVMIWDEMPDVGFPKHNPTPAEWQAWRQHNTVFTDIAATQSTQAILGHDGEPEEVPARNVTASLWTVLGVRPLMGRVFTQDEEARGVRVVVLSHGLWQRRFGASPDVLGRTIVVNDKPYEVIGVMPRTFYFLPARDVELWMPTTFPAWMLAAWGWHDVHCVARLKPGVTLQQARDAMAALSLQVSAGHVKPPRSAVVMPLREELAGKTYTSLGVLFGASVAVLLIACVNLANLLMSRGAGRRREVAVRAALGAGRGRLITQFLIESLLLAGLGAVAGLGLAFPVMRFLETLVPETMAAVHLRLDWRVLAFSVVIALAAGVTFGLAPAIRGSRSAGLHGLREGGRGSAGLRSYGFQHALIVLETALAVVLLTSGGLLLHSLHQLQQLDLGIHREKLLTFVTPLVRYREFDRRVAFVNAELEKIRAIPGVVSAGAISSIPLTQISQSTGYVFPGQRADQVPDQDALTRVVSRDYFATVGARLREGRFFDISDRRSPSPVVVVNDAFANRNFPGRSPIGARFQFGRRDEKGYWYTIVGVVQDIRDRGVAAELKPTVYTVLEQSEQTIVPPSGIVVRTSVEPASMVAAVRQAIWSVDKNQPVTRVQTVDDIVARQLTAPAQNTALLGAFALLALLLASLGLYGVLSYAVTQRTNEIGVRMALGATSREIVLSVSRRGLALALAGLAIGVILAVAVARVMTTLFYGVRPDYIGVLAGVSFMLLAVAALASIVPARRASRIDPVIALQQE